MSKHYSSELKTQILTAYTKGTSVKSLSTTHGMAVSTIHKWIASKPKPLMDVTSIIKDEYLSLSINGLDIKISTKDISRLFEALKSWLIWVK